MTISIQIGNTDDKLSQRSWCEFTSIVSDLVDTYASNVWGTFYSLPNAPWQNACWIFELSRQRTRESFRTRLAEISGRYMQDSYAWLEGNSQIVDSVDQK